jgi:hypothetical protein
MATVTLTPQAYNDIRVRAVLTAHRAMAARNGNPPNGPGTEGGGRGIQGPATPPPATRINTGDSTRVSVTGGPASARRGGRPRQYATPAESNRARQRAYRARQAATQGGDR